MSKKEPWEECPDVWKSKAAFFNWMRGQMRRAWSRHPVKIKFINSKRYKAPLGKVIDKKTGEPKLVWAGTCECCGGTFTTKQLQVDHISGAGSFQGWDDFEEWMHGLMHLCCSDLQYLCSACHDVKSYAERHNIGFAAARLEKEVIKFKKLSAKQQVAMLVSLDKLPGENAGVRVEQYRSHLNAREAKRVI